MWQLAFAQRLARIGRQPIAGAPVFYQLLFTEVGRYEYGKRQLG